MARPHRTDAELREASNHVAYGLNQLAQAAERLARAEPDRIADPIIRNALIESFVGHVRPLMEFFDSNAAKAHDDDILAIDFFDDARTWFNLRPPPHTDLDGIRDRVNKQLAHLSYRRNGISEDDKRWPFVAIARALEPAATAFARAVPQSRLGALWPEDVRGGDRSNLSVTLFPRI
jgi:hypothetical protein